MRPKVLQRRRVRPTPPNRFAKKGNRSDRFGGHLHLVDLGQRGKDLPFGLSLSSEREQRFGDNEMQIGNLRSHLKSQICPLRGSKCVACLVETPLGLKHAANDKLQVRLDSRWRLVIEKRDGLFERLHSEIKTTFELVEITNLSKNLCPKEVIACQACLLVKS